MIIRQVKRVILLNAFLAIGIIANAQPPAGGGPGGGEEPLPISGIEWLLLAGGVLGVRRFYLKARKK